MTTDESDNDSEMVGAGNFKLVGAQFVVDESEAEAFVIDLQQSGGKIETEPEPFEPPPEEIDEYADGQFEPLLVVAVAVSAAHLIRIISKLWLDHSRPGGMIVDARNNGFVSRHAPHVERNTLVVITDEKIWEFKEDQQQEGLDLLKILAK